MKYNVLSMFDVSDFCSVIELKIKRRFWLNFNIEFQLFKVSDHLIINSIFI